MANLWVYVYECLNIIVIYKCVLAAMDYN